jgi:hypothetical protein
LNKIKAAPGSGNFNFDWGGVGQFYFLLNFTALSEKAAVGRW